MKDNYTTPYTQVIEVGSETIFASSNIESCTIESASVSDEEQW